MGRKNLPEERDENVNKQNRNKDRMRIEGKGNSYFLKGEFLIPKRGIPNS